MSYDPYGQPTQQPAPYQQAGYAASPYAAGVAPKSKTTAALLAFFLGGFGAHNFYRGQKGRGIGHIVLAAVGFIIMIIAIVGAASQIDAAGDISDSAAASVGLGVMVGYFFLIVNGIWAFVEFIMILMSNDGSLR
ncbi:TM2 domain-containing protein [Actinomyces trachealis]|uniref:TM2 domain-containing protein n=1 Tax=Actinomyces trachealis TaxID=2763540 RepID=UPI001892D148|nr:TM2 domain-containing protein [Actinomyces trachealis]